MRALPRLAALLAVVCGAVLPRAPATAVELVRNGGFEDADLSSWRFRGLSYERVAAPDAPEGAYVVRMSIDPTRGDPQWVAQQALPFVTPGAAYVFGAGLAVSGGTAQARALIEWMDADGGFGNSVLTSVTDWTARADGVFQTVEARASAPALARSALIRIEVRSVTSGVGVRVDAVRVDGPPPASPTPTGTPTDEPSTTPTLTVTPTVSPSPTVTLTPGPGEALRNPGFEEVADGVPVAWQKYGGELVTTARARSGERAGLLRSASDATKWAYQTVLVEGGAWYEFDAWVLSEDPAVERALLRVSWYASADGSGAALATADSTSALGEPGRAYRHLTTGPVQAPPEARSARPRILLAPAGAGPASIAIDDAGWRGTAPPTATPTATATSTALSTAGPSVEPAAHASPAPRPAGSERPHVEVRAATASRAEEPRAPVRDASARPASPAPWGADGVPLDTRRTPRRAPWWFWTAGGAATIGFVAALTAVVSMRRRRIS